MERNLSTSHPQPPSAVTERTRVTSSSETLGFPERPIRNTLDVCTGGLGFLDLLDQALDKERTPLWVDTVGEQLLGQGAEACQETKLGAAFRCTQGNPLIPHRPATVLPDSAMLTDTRIARGGGGCHPCQWVSCGGDAKTSGSKQVGFI